MIEEAYCSFEVSKLLKENGMDKRYFTYYIQKNNTDGTCEAVTTCTHQMAMRWLREEYKIAINIRITCKETISYAFDIWDFTIIHPNEFVGGTIDLLEQQFDFKSYEEAVEAALKYVLENLI